MKIQFLRYSIFILLSNLIIQLQPVCAQDLSERNYVLGMGGTAKNVQFSGKTVHFRQSIGQNGITGTLKNKKTTLIQGFIHPVYIKKDIAKSDDLNIEIQLSNDANSYIILIKEDIRGTIYTGLYNLLGKRVYYNTFRNVNSFNINIDLLPHGVYILSIRTINKTFSTKLIKP
ncbi:MAG: T9SS type A sorting domain-containing protein [Bacteroidales bacterium]|nr:T9SS type A sorting domain-containing protein [Bacteroidales bacterium]